MSALDRKLTVQELAARWGFSMQAIYRLVHHPDPAKRVPYVRIGRGIRFEEAALDRWLSAQRSRFADADAGRITPASLADEAGADRYLQ